jgi:hypothetical protein
MRKKAPEKLPIMIQESFLIIKSSELQREASSETVKLLPVTNPPSLEENRNHPGT